MLVLLLQAAPVSAAGLCDEPVETTEGPVQGEAAPGSAACAWKGIPYAAPPLSGLRWKPPRDAPARDGVLEAAEYGCACPQVENLTSGGSARCFSEDCLTLNIWRPAKSGVFPVMLWLHGGGFMQGTGTYEMYNGARLSAEGDVVVVTINYRIGHLGFLALPELAAEHPEGSNGNYGMMDQIKALQWVHDNILGFGGNPDNVTVFGQSAGGISICALLVSPLSEGLFHKAINMSGPCDMIQSQQTAYARGREAVAELGCDGPGMIECLRAKPFEEFLPESPPNLLEEGGPIFSPNIDGYVIPDWPLELIGRGEYHRMPVIVGNTKEELKVYLFETMGVGLWPRRKVRKMTGDQAGPYAEDILSMYSFDEFRRPWELYIGFATDAVFASRTWMMARALDERSPVWVYQVDWDDHRFPNKLGAFHGIDVPMVFKALDLDILLAKLLVSRKALKSGVPLSEDMMTYYTNFARTGDPNGDTVEPWPEYDTADKKRLHFDHPLSVREIPEKDLARYRYFSDKTLEEITAGIREKKN